MTTCCSPDCESRSTCRRWLDDRFVSSAIRIHRCPIKTDGNRALYVPAVRPVEHDRRRVQNFACPQL